MTPHHPYQLEFTSNHGLCFSHSKNSSLKQKGHNVHHYQVFGDCAPKRPVALGPAGTWATPCVWTELCVWEVLLRAVQEHWQPQQLHLVVSASCTFTKSSLAHLRESSHPSYLEIKTHAERSDACLSCPRQKT